MSHLWVATRGCLAFLVAALAYLIRPAASSNAAIIRIPLTELSAVSELIVRGRVERIESEWAASGAIESIVYVRLADAPRGRLSRGALMPVRVRGGTVDGVGMRESEEATFAVGEDVYLFLDGLRDGAYRVVEGKQGKYEVVGSLAVNRVWNQAFPLDALDEGARGGAWPAESAACPPPPTPQVSSGPAGGGLALGAAAPDAYVYNSSKWFGPDPMEERYAINVNTADAGGANGSADAFRNAIRAAATTWNNAGAAFSFKYEGPTAVVPGDQYDGVNSIAWINMGNTSTLAQATWWFYDRGSIDQLFEVDIKFNDYYSWDATGSPSGNEPDLQSVATHELGHWLSFGHDTDSVCSSCPASGPIMCPCYPLGSLKRNLASNDTAGIRAVYGMVNPPTSTPTNTPTATLTPTRTSTPTRTPTPRPTLAPWQIKDREYLPLILRR